MQNNVLYVMNSNRFIKYKNNLSVVIKTYHINIKKKKTVSIKMKIF